MPSAWSSAVHQQADISATDRHGDAAPAIRQPPLPPEPPAPAAPVDHHQLLHHQRAPDITAATEAMESYLKRAPDAQFVSLQGFDLIDLVPFMPHLERLTSMRTLTLSHNALRRLPDEMSSLRALETLDLTHNAFRYASDVVRGLYSLRRLRHLRIHLPEAEEETLIATLSTLRSLNGVALDDSEDEAAGRPAGIAGVGFRGLASDDDATAPPSEDYDGNSTPTRTLREGEDGTAASSVSGRAGGARGGAARTKVATASTGPSKAQLREERRVAQLEATRGYVSPGGRSAGNRGAATSLSNKFQLEPWTGEKAAKYRRLQHSCSIVAGSLANPQEYDQFHSTVLTHLNARLKGEPDVLRQQVHQFHASALLLEYANEELARAAGKYGGDMEEAMRLLANANQQAMQHASSVMLALQEDRDRKLAAIQKDLLAELQHREYTRVAPATAQRAGGESGGEGMDGTRGSAASGGRATPPPQPTTAAGTRSSSVGGGLGSTNRSVGGGAHKGQDATSTGPDTKTPAADDTFIAAMRDERRMAQRKGLPMGLPALRQVIRDVFQSKGTHDEANTSAQLPGETLEQHLYTYFTGKFTTKEAIRSAVASVLSSVTSFVKLDVDVAVFGRILHQDVDEGYWHVHEALKSAVYDCVYHELVGQGEERTSQEMIHGQLNPEQVRRVLEAVFPGEDVAWRERGLIKRMLRQGGGVDFSQSGVDSGWASDSHREFSSSSAFAIGYREFSQAVQIQELEHRVRELRPFVQAFQRLDTDRVGVIDGVQLRVLVDELLPGLSGAEEQAMLRAVDPFSTNVMLFSDVVNVLARRKRRWWVSSTAGRGKSDTQQSGSHRPEAFGDGQHGRASPARNAAKQLARKRSI